MAGGAALLKRPGFDLDTAVFLAEASSTAYDSARRVEAWARGEGFDSVSAFASHNVQGFWCGVGDIALLAFRGSSNLGQWLRDARFFPARHPWGRVHIGFQHGVAAVEGALRDFDGAARRAAHVWITGHSLGGALALVAAARLKRLTGVAALMHTYGQPAVGLNDFAERFSVELPGRLWRFVNQSDIVTRLPPGPFYRHAGIVKRIVRPGVLESLATILEAAPFAFEPSEAARDILAGGAALEAADAAKSARIDRPQFIDISPPPLSELEFAQLQFALGAAEPSLEGAVVEGVFDWFGDHAIADYIRLLAEIRDSAPSRLGS